MESKTKYTHRFLARIVMEATTPLAVGSGEKDILTDALVATDVNGLPYIPGTSLTGIIRHAIDEIKQNEEPIIGNKYSDAFFGYQSFGKSTDGKGSEIIFTDAKMIGKDGKAIDGLRTIDWNNDFYAHYRELSIRQHAKIDHKGVTVKAGKFDEQVVFKGTRFCFEMEMVSDGNNFDKFEQVLEQLQSDTFRVGSGTRCGFGEMKILSCQTKQLDLTKPDDLKEYLDKSSSLAENFQGKKIEEADNQSGWTKYELTLAPEDFFLFGSGFGDDEADMTPVKGSFVDWSNGIPQIKENAVLIPATSLKGALSHRVAFYYNKLNGVFAENLKDVKQDDLPVGKNNEAVKLLFGSEGEMDKETNKMKNQLRGNVVFSDIIEDKKVKEKILNHVSIDRFTGGAIDGALFTEKTTYGKGQEFKTTILVNNTAFKTEKVQEAFESALNDICSGMLPLGGGVNRGNGCFKGKLIRGETEICNYIKEDEK